MLDEILNFKYKNLGELKKFQNKIINSTSARNMFYFAKYVKGADVELLLDKVLETNDVEYIHYFASNIKLKNYEKIINKIIELKDAATLFYISIEVPVKHQDLILKISKSLYELSNKYFLKYMDYYFCVFDKNDDEIYLLLKNYLDNNKKEYKLNRNNIKEILYNLRKEEDKKYRENNKNINGYSKNCFVGRKNIIPDIIVYHITSSYDKAISIFYDRNSDVSSHFVIGKDGKSKQILDLKDSSWANGTSSSDESDVYYKLATNKYIKERKENANYYTYSIECETLDGTLTHIQYEKIVDITLQIINHIEKEYNVMFNIDREHLIGHNEVNPIVRTIDPGIKFPLERIIDDVKRKYENINIIVESSIREIGTKAINNNIKYNTEYFAKEVSGDSYPYCCIFIWWIFKQCNLSNILCTGKRIEDVIDVLNWGRKNNLIIDKENGQKGDIAIYDWSGKSSTTDHIGIVKENIDNNNYYVVEGNTGEGSNKNNGEVMLRKRNIKYIVCFVRPKY